jgi:hypothetical protein
MPSKGDHSLNRTRAKSFRRTSNLVLTPGGYRDPRLVHVVSKGCALRATNAGTEVFDLATGIAVASSHPRTKTSAAPRIGSGWIAYAYWNNGTGRPITSFEATWRIPRPPQSISNQTIFLFSGIQNYGYNFGILQPVLQWGISAAGGGPFWSVASWYVASNGEAFHTPLSRVQSRNILVGVMTRVPQEADNFDYGCEFVGVANTKLQIKNIAELLWCNFALEAYSMNDCSNYPSDNRTSFSLITILTKRSLPALEWTPAAGVTDCGEHVSVVSDANPGGRVDIYY